MAEMETSGNVAARGGIRSKKRSTRVDLTPMVDLGFLLITFFIFTTTLNASTAMKLIMPDESEHGEPPTQTAESKTISFLLGPDNTISFYNGSAVQEMQPTSYAASGIRSVIMQKMAGVEKKFGNRNETVVLIKPTSEASYQNVVAVLDEMLINQVKKYVLMDTTPEELQRILKKE